MKEGKGKNFITLIITFILIGVIGSLGTSLFRYIEDHNGNQKEAKISLNELIKEGKDIPTGEYVGVDVRWVLGPYATNTETVQRNGIKTTSSVENYYYLILDDMTIMSVKSRNADEVAKMDAMTKWLTNVDGFPTDGEVLHLQGNIEKITNSELLKYFDENLNWLGLTKSSAQVKHLNLNTTVGRSGVYVWVFAAVAVVVIVIIVMRRKKKKQEEMDMMEQMQQTEKKEENGDIWN